MESDREIPSDKDSCTVISNVIIIKALTLNALSYNFTLTRYDINYYNFVTSFVDMGNFDF